MFTIRRSCPVAWVVLAGIAIGLLAGLGGCADPPWSAESNLRLTPEEEMQVTRLSFREQDAALRAMALPSAGLSSRPGESKVCSINSGGSVRFSDVEDAAFAAADSVEMAIVRFQREPGPPAEPNLIRIHLRTIEEWPALLEVQRVDGPEVYRAQAHIGRFPDDPPRIARANELLRAFDKFMLRYGRKRSLE